MVQVTEAAGGKTAGGGALKGTGGKKVLDPASQEPVAWTQLPIPPWQG